MLKNFLDTAEAEVRSLISLYSEVVSTLLVVARRIGIFPCVAG